MSIYALIPARAGSKGVPGKNVRLLDGAPLIAYSIAAGRGASKVERVIVSTDSTEIAVLAQSYGAEVPFLRPSEFASDTAPDRAYIEHALDWHEAHEGRAPDIIVLLRPTTPFREPTLIDEAIALIERAPEATSLRSVHPLPEPPQKMLKFEGCWLTGFFPDDPRPDYFNLPRQAFPTGYQPNGYVDILKTATVRASKDSLFGRRILGLETPVVTEVDTPEDFAYLEFQIAQKPPALRTLIPGVRS